MAEQLHVTLNACDHLALFFTSTISAVMVHTELTMPPPPIPAIARAAISQVMVCPTIQVREQTIWTGQAYPGRSTE
jgi:hypothetical protein